MATQSDSHECDATQLLDQVRAIVASYDIPRNWKIDELEKLLDMVPVNVEAHLSTMEAAARDGYDGSMPM